MDESSWDVIVVGGSAAGLSAALMLGRARRRVVVVDNTQPRNRFAAHMYGVLGHDGLDPRQLIAKGREEAAAYGVTFLNASVARVDDRDRTLATLTLDGNVRACRALIVATGITDHLPDIPGLSERWGRSVLHCPYCHGWEIRDRRLGVLATSPLAVHQAQLVRQWSDRVVFFSSEAGRLDPESERRLTARGIDVITSPVVEVLGEGEHMTGVRTAEGMTFAVDAIFTTSMPEPRDDFLKELHLARRDTPLGSFLVVDGTGRTSHARIWAAGNVTDPAQNVPMAVSAGAVAGAMANMALVTEDFDEALADLEDVA
jgi:thioredoxin reductase